MNFYTVIENGKEIRDETNADIGTFQSLLCVCLSFLRKNTVECTKGRLADRYAGA